MHFTTVVIRMSMCQTKCVSLFPILVAILVGCAGGTGVIRENVTWYPPSPGHYWASITYPESLIEKVSDDLRHRYGIENAVNLAARKKITFTLHRADEFTTIKTAVEGITSHTIPNGFVAFDPYVGDIRWNHNGAFSFDGRFVWKVIVDDKANRRTEQYEVISRFVVVGKCQCGRQGESKMVSITEGNVIWYPPQYSKNF